jgi:ribosomal-protein-alanine N-acetyltransferase
MIDVEPMRWWHIAAVHRLESVLFPGDPWSLEQFWQELAQQTRYYIVAMDHGEVVGYAGLFALGPDADVQTIAVRADRQGTGTGARLLQELLAGAASRGAGHILLEVRSDNLRALRLYERHGFEQISVRRRYYPDGGDALVMRAGIPHPDVWHAGRHG